ncbi:MAG: hypothetical protein WA130_03170 [Candidatus Methanoperedens sp.]
MNGKGLKNIDFLFAVAFVRLQHGIKENLSLVAYLTQAGSEYSSIIRYCESEAHKASPLKE